ncbi:hypothetical protein Dd1591_1292 [Dickeya chrysanthemi Ech1591]|uniref:Uncharacterized protein n=1 Tax=Dickeya chrysanthemi (strain Ech1591) TaxID=561229 RepID=C6CQG2_DICC1|nr:hypothetical protein Dd1591_1292 [Dickeya chrysanthemi Ech1591]
MGTPRFNPEFKFCRSLCKRGYAVATSCGLMSVAFDEMENEDLRLIL